MLPPAHKGNKIRKRIGRIKKRAKVHYCCYISCAVLLSVDNLKKKSCCNDTLACVCVISCLLVEEEEEEKGREIALCTAVRFYE